MNAIKDFMTRSPHAIGHDQTLKLAHERMHQFGVRQLPVLDRGVLVGVLDERDIALLGAMAPRQAVDATVEEAMSSEPYAVEPDTDAEIVTAHMAQHKSGCAVVMENKKVLGVFTSADALSLLTSLLRERKDGARIPRPVAVHEDGLETRAAARTAVSKAITNGKGKANGVKANGAKAHAAAAKTPAGKAPAGKAPADKVNAVKAKTSSKPIKVAQVAKSSKGVAKKTAAKSRKAAPPVKAKAGARSR